MGAGLGRGHPMVGVSSESMIWVSENAAAMVVRWLVHCNCQRGILRLLSELLAIEAVLEPGCHNRRDRIESNYRLERSRASASLSEGECRWSGLISFGSQQRNPAPLNLIVRQHKQQCSEEVSHPTAGSTTRLAICGMRD